MISPMKIAHISDLHFFSPKITFSHHFGKTLIGYVNAQLRRKNKFLTRHLDQCIASLIRDEIEVLIITGDFTTTADPMEFSMAKEFLKKVRDAEIKIYAVPGNHDAYTQKSFQEQMFAQMVGQTFTFSNEGIYHEKIHPHWDLILLDNTILNKPLSANGLFPAAQKAPLEQILKNCTNVIIANHFPLQNKIAHHNLLNSEALLEILKKCNGSVLYLHGHTHQTEYSNVDGKLHIFNSSETTVASRFTYHQITLLDDIFSYKQVEYYD